MATSKRSSTQGAIEAWQLMFEFLMQSAPERTESLRKQDLTPNDSRVLFALDIKGKAIGELARELVCDPSTATWLVDRLERLGFAERNAKEHDRRVKLVALTTKGSKAIVDLLRDYHRPPPQFNRLSVDDLLNLTRILKKLRDTDQVGEKPTKPRPADDG
jgi:DNA-binding MarR family transcriptional regulator